MKARINSIIAVAFLSPTLSWAACDLASGPQTNALVELYTSEGCSSCPPADKRLSEFPSREYALERLVPISLHVDYWDYIGWKEPFAQPRFSERQSWLVRANGHKTVFTPHFFVSATAARPAEQLGLFVALTEDKLTSSVSAGENRGATLLHDHVVREWIGPIVLNAGHGSITQSVPMRASWNSAQLGIAAFVQDLRTGQVLQAV